MNHYIFAPFASTFLILSAVTVVLPVSQGLPFILPPQIDPRGECGSGFLLVAEVGKAGIKLNGQLQADEEVDKVLVDFYRTRVERVLFVKAEGDIAYKDVIRFTDRANGLVEYLAVSLLTPAAEQEPCWGIRIPHSPIAPWLRYYRDHGTFPAH